MFYKAYPNFDVISSNLSWSHYLELIKIDDILIDGLSAGDVGELVLKDRELLSDNGIVIITATLDKKTKETNRQKLEYKSRQQNKENKLLDKRLDKLL